MFFDDEGRSTGVFLNEDLRLAQIAYLRVIGKCGDVAVPYQSEVARYVLRMYERGLVDPEKLAELTCAHFRFRHIFIKAG